MFLPLSPRSLDTEHHNYLLTDPAFNNKEAWKMSEILPILYDQKWLERKGSVRQVKDGVMVKSGLLS